jgi:general secretion pathway protein D
VKFLRILVVCAVAAAGADFAAQLYQQGLKAEHAGDYLHAYLLYSRAVALEPQNTTYVARKAATRGIAMASARQTLGPDPMEKEAGDGELDVSEQSLSAADLIEAREALPPPRLKPSAEKKTFDLRGDAQSVFGKVGEACGIQVVFDADYQSPPQFTFRMNDATCEDALRSLETQANSFLVAVNEKLALVLRDTPQKRTEHAPALAVAIPIPERMSIQDAQELLTAVQQTFDIRRAQADPGKRLVFLRDQASKVLGAEQLFHDLSQIRPQVEVDIQLIQVDKNSSLEYGLSLPNQISIVNFETSQTLPQAWNSLLHLTGAATPLGLGITSATAFATLSLASSVTLIESQMVALDGQAASLHVGEHYPVAGNQYIGTTSGTAGQVFTPPVQVNYVDLGLVLKLTPSVNEGGDVTLDVDAAFTELGAATVDSIPVIANTQYTGKVRLATGEWAVLAGLVEHDETVSLAGFPGLDHVPILGKLFSNNTITKDSSDVLLVMKPHVTTAVPWDRINKTVWVGTESRPLTLY